MIYNILSTFNNLFKTLLPYSKEYDNSNEKIEVLRENIGMPKKILFNDKC